MKYNYGEHIVVVGKTQSGKTYYVQRTLCRIYNNFIVFSEETKDNWEDITEITIHSVAELDKAIKDKCHKIYYEPANYKDETDFIQEWDNVCKYVFDNLENIALINDEVADVSSSMKIESYHFRLIRKGAKRKISMISATQRPQQVNKTIWTQSAHKLIFKVDLYEGSWLQDYILDKEKCMSIKENYVFYYDDRITAEIFRSKTQSIPFVEKKEKLATITIDDKKGEFIIKEVKDKEKEKSFLEKAWGL